MNTGSAAQQVFLREWEASESDDPKLARASFGRDEAARRLAAELSAYGCLQTEELATGMRFQATSFVGRIRLGGAALTLPTRASEGLRGQR